ncbi:MAG: DNA polymerase III subunit delta [Chlorobi bacterium]|jgi:DNA polymerase-3 subunit delta|nr:DNA polymerase III subunit delta [Chlorobiota bacterium]
MLIESATALLRAKQFPRVVFLFGEEEFLVEETAEQLVGIARERGIAGVDIETLDGEDITAEQLVRRAEAFPMAGPERLIVVRRFDRIPLGKRNSAEQTLLASYLRSPSPTTMLVLLAAGDGSPDELKGLAAALSNPKQRAKAEAKLAKLRFPYNALIEHAAWLEFPRLYERQIPEWIVRRFKAHGCDCPIEVAEYLVVQVGTSLRDLANEISKVLLFVGGRKRIAIEDVLAVSGASRVYNIFELQKAIGERQVARALKILHYMVRTERQDLLIVAMLARYFSILWRLGELQSVTSNHAELGRAVGISPFFVPEYLAALKRYTTEQIEHAIELLHRADVELKTTSLDTLTVLERTLLDIMEPTQNKAPLLPKGRLV